MQLEINSGDTAWVLVSVAMVMLMTPGVGLFYGGLVRSKTVVSMIGLSFLSPRQVRRTRIFFNRGMISIILLETMGKNSLVSRSSKPHLFGLGVMQKMIWPVRCW